MRRHLAPAVATAALLAPLALTAAPATHALASNTVSADFDGDGALDTATLPTDEGAVVDGKRHCDITFDTADGAQVTHTLKLDIIDEPDFVQCPNRIGAADFDGDGVFSTAFWFDLMGWPTDIKNVQLLDAEGNQSEVPLRYKLFEESYTFADLNNDGRSDTVLEASPSFPAFTIGMTSADGVPTAGEGEHCGVPHIKDVDASNPGPEIVADTGFFACSLPGGEGITVYRGGVGATEVELPLEDPELDVRVGSRIEEFGDFNNDGIDGDIRVYLGDPIDEVREYYNDGNGHYTNEEPPAELGPLETRRDRVVMYVNSFEKADINVLGNDILPTGDVTVEVTSAPWVGTAEALDNGRIRYDRTGKGWWIDHFEYTVTDSSGRTSSADVWIVMR